MKYMFILLSLVLAAGCSKQVSCAKEAAPKVEVQKDFAAGDCIHFNDYVVRVTVVGQDSYGFMVLNRGESYFATLPKVDANKIAVKADCWDTMKEENDLYLIKTKIHKK